MRVGRTLFSVLPSFVAFKILKPQAPRWGRISSHAYGRRRTRTFTENSVSAPRSPSRPHHPHHCHLQRCNPPPSHSVEGWGFTYSFQSSFLSCFHVSRCYTHFTLNVICKLLKLTVFRGLLQLSEGPLTRIISSLQDCLGRGPFWSIPTLPFLNQTLSDTSESLRFTM